MRSMDLLLDTHVWFWFLIGSRRLSSRARTAIESADERWLSAISIWELGLLALKGRVEIEGSYRSWVDRAIDAMPVTIAPMDHDVALASFDLALDHPDPADRFIAATAVVHDVTLVTADARLLGRTWLATLKA